MPTATRSSIIDISKEETTQQISKKLSNKLKQGDLVFFYGDIGVGKTTFIKFLINNIQLKKKVNITEIPSPTFTIVNEYKIDKLEISHYDLYRIKRAEELDNIGFFENYMNQLTLVEWPEIIKKKPANRLELFFKYEENYNKRTLEMHAYNTEQLIDEFK